MSKLPISVFIILVSLVAASHARNDNDIPIQIVKPAINHRDLEIVESKLAYLRNLKGPVAIVGVVGKFHSGKSFLMNQLMGKSAGFGIGPSVEPTTMGIWMWGEPLVIESPITRQRLNLVFMDTEGFSAKNISENYDAKVFAVSTLLSSHLLYNSVKIIDQSEIDYLELLARRTQLFALRSQLSKSKWTGQFDHDLLTFPPLTWVVQDFVQETQNFVSSTEWLRQLMGSHSRESDNYTISLLDIFKDVNCHTLYIPATEEHLLMDLSKAKDADLTSKFRKDRDQLIQKLRNSVTPKEKGDAYVTGSDLAKLLEILVNAANDGSLADVPSRWDALAESLKTTAPDDCTAYYVKELDAYLNDQNKNEPVSLRSFDLTHQQIKTQSFELLDQILHGLEETLTAARRDLGTRIETHYLTKRDLNDKKIKVKCNQIKSRLELVAEEQLRKLSLPVRSESLKKHAESISIQLLRAFQDDISDIVDTEMMQNLSESFEKSLKVLTASVESSNKALIESSMAKISQSIIENFDEAVGYNPNVKMARKPDILNKIIDQVIKNSQEDYEVKTMQFINEESYQGALKLFTQQLQTRKEMAVKRNQELASDNISKSIDKYLDKFTEKIRNIQLPIDEANLNSRLLNEASQIVEEFENQFADFNNCCNYTGQLDRLKEKILSLGQSRQQDNVRAYKTIVKDVLISAKGVINLSSDKYTSEYSFRRFVTSVASSLLAKGESATWSESLKKKVIEDFINEDPDIRNMLEARQGFFGFIIGIIDRILSFFGL